MDLNTMESYKKSIIKLLIHINLHVVTSLLTNSENREAITRQPIIQYNNTIKIKLGYLAEQQFIIIADILN